MTLFLKRAAGGTLFLTSQTSDEKPRAVGIVFTREAGDGFGWKAGDLRDDLPYPDETTALEACYSALNFRF
jgi:hypothetical protein